MVKVSEVAIAIALVAPLSVLLRLLLQPLRLSPRTGIKMQYWYAGRPAWQTFQAPPRLRPERRDRRLPASDRVASPGSCIR
jgi:hypothetical protein